MVVVAEAAAAVAAGVKHFGCCSLQLWLSGYPLLVDAMGLHQMLRVAL